MPKIKITDIDKTGVVQSGLISNTVYIPGKSCYKRGGSGDTVYSVEPTLFTSMNALKEKNFGTGTTAIYYDDSSLSYKLMVHLLELGISVLYEGVEESIPGTCPAIDWTRLEDKGLYDIRFLTMGGYSVSQAGMVTCAANRGDCVALLDHPVTMTAGYDLLTSQPADWVTAWVDKYLGNVYTKSVSYEAINAFVPFVAGLYYLRTGTGTYTYTVLNVKPEDWTQVGFPKNKYFSSKAAYTVVDEETAPSFVEDTYYLINSDQVAKVRAYFESFKAGDTSYSAAFTPGFKSSLESLGGSVTTPVHIPASFGYLFAYAKALRNNPDWYAVSGGQRGLISELTSVEYAYSSAEIEKLQGRAKSGEVALDDESDNVGCAINPIAYVRPFGYIIWGNRTFKENDAVKKTTASSFLNVRNLVSTVKKALYDAARKYSFEPNSEILWINFKAQLIPLLDKMKAGNGILDYKFVKLATTAKARLKARLIIIPIEAVEDFEIEVELNDSISTTEE